MAQRFVGTRTGRLSRFKFTPARIVIQRDQAILMNSVNSGEPDALKCEESGFCGHVEGVQRYNYHTDPEAV
jgi:hypothetical protein